MVLKMIISKFGHMTVEQGLNALVPLLGSIVGVVAQIVEHADTLNQVIKIVKLLKD